MKRLVVSLFAFLLVIGLNAQSYYNVSYSPNVAEFLESTGDYLIEDVYNVDKSKINLKVVILTDFHTGKKIGYADYTFQDATSNIIKAVSIGAGYYAGEFTFYSSSIDYDELQKCIDLLEYAKINLWEKDSDKSRLYYTTKLGGRIGIKWENGSWHAFVNADPYGDASFERTIQLVGNNMEKIISAFKTAKSLIEEKTNITLASF